MYQTISRTTAMLSFQNGGNDIAIRNLVIEGTNLNATFASATEHGHAIQLGGTLRGEISGVTIRYTWGDGIYIVGGYLPSGAFRWADGVSIHDNVIRHVGRMGIALTDGERNVLIQRNTVSETAWYDIDVEPNGNPGLGADHVQILDNTLGLTGLRDPATIYQAVSFGPAANVPMGYFEVRRNLFTGVPIRVASSPVTRYPSLFITDNRSDTLSGTTPMQLNNIDGLTVTGNVQPLAVGKALVNCVNCTNVVISGNS